MKVIFMGTPDFAVATAEAIYQAGHEIVLVVTQPDKPKGRGKEMQYSDVKNWALSHEIPVFQPVKIKDEEAICELKKYQADIGVVAAFGQILPEVILNMPRLGCINVHASLLPKYRGAAPIQWSILNGEEKTGVTIMQMGVGLDDGDILSVEEVEITSDVTGGELFDQLAEVGGKLCVRTMEQLNQGQIQPIPQCEEEATKVGMIKKELGHIDWSMDAATIERYIRGLNPWPSAYTSWQGKTLKIWRAAVIDDLNQEGCTYDLKSDSPSFGQVVFVDKKTCLIATGQSFLSLLEVQLEGKKRMPIEDFLRGNAIEMGQTLGLS